MYFVLNLYTYISVDVFMGGSKCAGPGSTFVSLLLNICSQGCCENLVHVLTFKRFVWNITQPEEM